MTDQNRPSRADVRAAVCDHLETWARVMAENHGHDHPDVKAIKRTFLMITKSSLLARLIFGGETLRTVKCPKHEGRWVGLETPWNRCEHGCQMTGWLPVRDIDREACTPRSLDSGNLGPGFFPTDNERMTKQ